MNNGTTGCLVKLAILTSLVSIGAQCYDQKSLPATLIKTETDGNCSYYFIDTDKNLKTAEYVLTTEIGSSEDIQLKAKILNHIDIQLKSKISNHIDQSPFQMPLNKWRSYSSLFEHVRN